MKVEVWLKGVSQPIVYENATSTYIGEMGLYCIYEQEKQYVTKWPRENIWRVIEDYPDSSRRTLPDKKR